VVAELGLLELLEIFRRSFRVSSGRTCTGLFRKCSPHIGKMSLTKRPGTFRTTKNRVLAVSKTNPAQILRRLLCAEMVVRSKRYPLLPINQSTDGRENDTRDRVNRCAALTVHVEAMNCPHHIKIFASQPHFLPRSSRAPRGVRHVYRWEQSGDSRDDRVAVHSRDAHFLHRRPGAQRCSAVFLVNVGSRPRYEHYRCGVDSGSDSKKSGTPITGTKGTGLPKKSRKTLEFFYEELTKRLLRSKIDSS